MSKEQKTSSSTFVERLATFLPGLQNAPSDFAVSGAAPELPYQPFMCVKGIMGGGADVPLPVNQDVAERLKAVAEPVDHPGPQKAWEIDAAKISFKHPDWDKSLRNLVRRALLALGCHSCSSFRIEPMLDKVVLHEGGWFEAQNPSPERKDDNAFASLVVQFPSVYSGGELVMKHGGRKVTATFGKEGIMHHYAAFFNDIEHSQYEPIASGHRLTPTYSLRWNKKIRSPPPRISTHCTPLEGLVPLLSSWALEKDWYTGPIGFELGSWNRLNNGMKSLNGPELEVVKSLLFHNKYLPPGANLYVELIVLQRIDDKVAIRCVYDLDGGSKEAAYDSDTITVINSKSKGAADLNSLEWWGKDIPASEDPYCSRFHSGSNALSKTVYKKNLVVFYPARHKFQQLMKCRKFESAARWLLNSIRSLKIPCEKADSLPARFVLDRYWDLHWEPLISAYSSNHIYGAFSTLLFDIVTQSKRRDHAARLLSICENFQTNEILQSSILNFIGCFGWDSFKSSLPRLILRNHDRTLDIASTLLRASVVPKDDDLITTISSDWESFLSFGLDGMDEEVNIRPLWFFLSALNKPDESRRVAIELNARKRFATGIFRFLQVHLKEDAIIDPNEKAFVLTLLDGLFRDLRDYMVRVAEEADAGVETNIQEQIWNCLEDKDAVLDDLYEYKFRLDPILKVLWKLFENMRDDERLAVLSDLVVERYTDLHHTRLLEILLGPCLPPEGTIENASPIGRVLVCWLQIVYMALASGRPVESHTGETHDTLLSKFRARNERLADPIPDPISDLEHPTKQVKREASNPL